MLPVPRLAAFLLPRFKGDNVAVWCRFQTNSTNLFSVRRQEIVGTILGGRLSSVLCPVGPHNNNSLFSRFLLSPPRFSQHVDQNDNRIDLITRFRAGPLNSDMSNVPFKKSFSFFSAEHSTFSLWIFFYRGGRGVGRLLYEPIVDCLGIVGAVLRRTPQSCRLMF